MILRRESKVSPILLLRSFSLSFSVAAAAAAAAALPAAVFSCVGIGAEKGSWYLLACTFLRTLLEKVDCSPLVALGGEGSFSLPLLLL